MTTRGTLNTRIRVELQEVTPGFWADSELNLWEDEAHAEIVVSTRQEATSTLTLANGTESYALPTDFYLARRVELQTSVGSATAWMEVRPYSLDRRIPGDPLSVAILTSVPIGYYIFGNKIYFIPVPDAAYGGTLYYYKNATAFTGDSDSPSYPEGISAARVDSLIVDYTVAKALTKRQDSAFSVYAGRYDAGLQALIRDAGERGSGMPMQVVNDWDDS